MISLAAKVGPKDHGRLMPLEEFEPAQVEEGHLYELSRGIITVSDIPGLPHLLQLLAVRNQLDAYKEAYKGQIYAILGGMECKLPIWKWNSERHPDLSI